MFQNQLYQDVIQPSVLDNKIISPEKKNLLSFPVTPNKISLITNKLGPEFCGTVVIFI